MTGKSNGRRIKRVAVVNALIEHLRSSKEQSEARLGGLQKDVDALVRKLGDTSQMPFPQQRFAAVPCLANVPVRSPRLLQGFIFDT